LRLLTVRVYELEQTVQRLQGGLAAAPVPRQAPRQAPSPPAAPSAPAPARPQPSRPPLAPPPRRPQPAPAPIQWRRLAEQVFTARTLAWAGGVATALGVILLFVMAASRGWVTPPMRVATGLAVSAVLIGTSFELDRRKVRAHAILAAAGAGVAGLYASLFAAVSVYHLVGEAAGLAGAAAIATVAVLLAIRIRQEPLAIFGIGASMLAPALVERQVTGAGVVFAAVIAAAGIPLLFRYRWLRVAAVAWLLSIPMLLQALVQAKPGTSPAVLAGALFVAVFASEIFIVELRGARRRIDWLGWSFTATAFAVSMGTALRYAGDRDVLGGHLLSGFVVLGVAALYALFAAVPVLVRRRHPDLTDLMAGFSLAAVATATGLLVGGPALVCAWAAESVAMVAFGERVSRRGPRRLRALAAAAVYLALAIGRAAPIVDSDQLHRLGTGSLEGTIALVAIAVAGIVFCYGVRDIGRDERVAAWLIPAGAIAYLPAWSLPPEWAVVAYAGLAALLLVHRRSRFAWGWMRDEAEIMIAVAYWAIGVAESLAVAAAFSDIFPDHPGARVGVPGLVALVAAGAVATWSLRVPRRPLVEFVLVAPFAVAAYLLADLFPAQQTIWAGLAVATAVAASVHLPRARRLLGELPLLLISVAYLAGALLALASIDRTLMAFVVHGRSGGWGTVTLAVPASLVVASAFRDRRQRSYAVWVAFALGAQLAAMVLPGQWVVVSWAGLSVLASAIAILWPAALAARAVRRPFQELAAGSAVALAVLVAAAYETPTMLFVANHHPASGLAAALAVTGAICAAAWAAAAGEGSWKLLEVPVAKAGVCLAAAAGLWTLAATLLGATQLRVAHPGWQSVHDAFQQGQVLVSTSWVLVGLALVIASIRGHRRLLRIGGIALLFAALGKLFLYDLAFLTAMARAVSFIVTGSVLLLAALLLQRFAAPLRQGGAGDAAGPAGG
ncbi:MAG TPA: DUF2339 domain-containing protein, partial [Gaiellales bacterium]|nr:DUF2339 domain-containing protein [Gaiellales bacterium]